MKVGIGLAGAAYELYCNSEMTMREVADYYNISYIALKSKIQSLEKWGYSKSDYLDRFGYTKNGHKDIRINGPKVIYM